MKKIMILGGSNCQIHAFERAREIGLETVLADYFPHPPASSCCGTHERISTFDANACIQAARRHRIDGIMTLGTDQPVLTCAEVAAAVGLPSALTPEQALTVTNKKTMKAFFERHGIPAARSVILKPTFCAADFAHLTPPFVTKPLDLQGQRGVFKIMPDELTRDLFDRVRDGSRCSEILLEEYYPSQEITFSGWVNEGTLYPLAITDRISQTNGMHIGICTSHRFPSVHIPQYYDEIVGIARRITDALLLKSGPVYFQMLIGQSGVLVNEIACRIGGAFEDVFIPKLSGFAILDAVIRQSLGEPVCCDMLERYDMRRCEKEVRVLLLFTSGGRIRAIEGMDTLPDIPSVVDFGLNYQAGDTIQATENATARLGHIVLVANSEKQLLDDIGAVYRSLRILNEAGENILLP